VALPRLEYFPQVSDFVVALFPRCCAFSAFSELRSIFSNEEIAAKCFRVRSPKA
jgi:hypothetical protein